MKLVVQVKLLPTSVQASALEATLSACDRAAAYASRIAFAKKLKDRNGLQREVYAELKAGVGLSAQPAVRVVKKVVDAYASVRGRSRRCRRGGGSPVVFRPDAAQPFDDRRLSWRYDARTVSIWTVEGWLKGNVRRQQLPRPAAGPLPAFAGP